MLGAEPRRTTVVVRTELTVHDDGRVTTETTSNTSVEVDWDWDPNAWLEVSECWLARPADLVLWISSL